MPRKKWQGRLVFFFTLLLLERARIEGMSYRPTLPPTACSFLFLSLAFVAVGDFCLSAGMSGASLRMQFFFPPLLRSAAKTIRAQSKGGAVVYPHVSNLFSPFFLFAVPRKGKGRFSTNCVPRLFLSSADTKPSAASADPTRSFFFFPLPFSYSSRTSGGGSDG